ncbi:MAG: ABC transporter permease [Clostridiales bacterium]|nr:ABC transporter permease [Clostridiales bacterium]
MGEKVQTPTKIVKKKTKDTAFARVAKYSSLRLLSLFITVIIGVYLTIMIANMGGYVDKIMKGQIREKLIVSLREDPNYQLMEPTAKATYFEARVINEEKRLGLDQPFMIRSFRFLYNAIRLDLGQAQFMTSDAGSRSVKLIILERLPSTLLLMGTANFVLFFATIALALVLSRKYGSFWDKFFITASPLSAMPSWFYGIFLIMIFAAVFKILPFGGMIGSPPPETTGQYIVDVLIHLILPAASLIISAFPARVYNWRTFFMIYSSEDYVEMAKAKGLSDKTIRNRYILRPTLPMIITSFSLMIIAMWTGAIITETVFLWPGIGRLIFQAVGMSDTAVIVGTTIIYAYMLAFTVFFLDFAYALVDPRVKIGSSSS